MPYDPRALIGVPFRFQGRDPAYGLDCVGLIALVTGVDAPLGYSLRSSFGAWCSDALGQHFTPKIAVDPGDILLLQAGPANLHLGIWMGASLVHADARIGRVVETPAPLPWPVIGIWGQTKGSE